MQFDGNYMGAVASPCSATVEKDLSRLSAKIEKHFAKSPQLYFFFYGEALG